MNNMTWAQLKNHIETMDDKQLNTNVTAYITEIDEFISVDDINYVVDEDEVEEIINKLVT